MKNKVGKSKRNDNQRYLNNKERHLNKLENNNLIIPNYDDISMRIHNDTYIKTFDRLNDVFIEKNNIVPVLDYNLSLISDNLRIEKIEKTNLDMSKCESFLIFYTNNNIDIIISNSFDAVFNSWKL